jgi:hypothetical protein
MCFKLSSLLRVCTLSFAHALSKHFSLCSFCQVTKTRSIFTRRGWLGDIRGTVENSGLDDGDASMAPFSLRARPFMQRDLLATSSYSTRRQHWHGLGMCGSRRFAV